VIASNFPTVLAALAERLMVEAGVEAGAAGGAVRHLLASAAANVAASDAVAALTGPVVRGDAATVAAHRRALAVDRPALAVYDALGRAAVSLARASGVPDAVLQPVTRALDDAPDEGPNGPLAAQNHERR
jgi:predicted short-subunit dehydrogenase-like oxidoreductase (DUF2520 family)